MSTIKRIKKALTASAAVVLLGFIACDPEDKFLQDESAYVAEDVISDFVFEDVDDLAGLALLADAATGGGRTESGPRNINVPDPRCGCPNVTVTITLDPASTSEHPVGTIVIDFGSGCSDPIGNVRKGKIVINFSGRRFQPGSTVITTFDGYSVNDIALSGTRTLTNISTSTEDAPVFQIELDNGQATWPDGTVATREHCFVRTWQRGTVPANDQLVVNQCADEDFAATGVNRRGRSYAMKIVEALVYRRGCPIAVSGIKEFTDLTTGKVITVDYGDGTCDRTITITVDGQSRSFEVTRRG